MAYAASDSHPRGGRAQAPRVQGAIPGIGGGVVSNRRGHGADADPGERRADRTRAAARMRNPAQDRPGLSSEEDLRRLPARRPTQEVPDDPAHANPSRPLEAPARPPGGPPPPPAPGGRPHEPREVRAAMGCDAGPRPCSTHQWSCLHGFTRSHRSPRPDPRRSHVLGRFLPRPHPGRANR